MIQCSQDKGEGKHQTNRKGYIMEYKFEVKNHRSNSELFLTTDDKSLGALFINHDQYGNDGDSGDVNSFTWNHTKNILKDEILSFLEKCKIKAEEVENTDDAIDSVLSAMQRN